MTNRIPLQVSIPECGDTSAALKVVEREFLKRIGKTLNVDIWPYTPKRSLQQNKVVMGFWMPIVMEEEYGIPYTEDEMLKVYNELKVEMGWVIEKVNLKTGEVRQFPAPTSTKDKAKYSEFMELFARNVQVNHGIFLPPPDRLKAVI